jgi:hypothetical protein
MEVRELTPDWEAGYEDFVANHPSSLLYYSLRFRDFLVDLLGCAPRYAVAVEQRRVTGILPAMVTDGPFGQVLNSLPYYGSNGGVLATSSSALGALAEWYREEVSDAAVGASTVVANPLEPDTLPPTHDLVDERLGNITFFPTETGTADDQVRKAIDGSARRNVRKAVEHGVAVEVENGSLSELEALHRASMELAGGEPKARALDRKSVV